MGSDHPFGRTYRAACLALTLLAVACRTAAPQDPPSGDAPPADAYTPGATEVEAREQAPARGEAAAAEATAELAPAAEAASTSKLHGSLTSLWRARWGFDDHDNDLREVLSLDYGDPERDRWTARFSGLLALDLDGDGQGPFFELSDTLGGDADLRVYDLYAEGRDLGPVGTLRLGRQSLWDTPVFVWFDGVTVESEPIGSDGVQFGAWGGQRVREFESSTSDDLVGGLYAQAQPWQAGRVRLDWMHLENEQFNGDSSNDLLSLGLWQGLGSKAQLQGGYTNLDGKSRDVTLRASWFEPDHDLQLQASYYTLLEGQADLAWEIDPFFYSLGALFPYQQARLMASKGLGEKVDLQAGLDLRRVDDSGDEGLFNRDYDRGFATLILDRVLPAELVLSLTGEIWDGGDDRIDTWGADLARDFGKDLRGSLGSVFQLYKSDLFASNEREKVRTWYTRLRWKASSATNWDVRYDAEDTEFGWFHTLRVAMTWHF